MSGDHYIVSGDCCSPGAVRNLTIKKFIIKSEERAIKAMDRIASPLLGWMDARCEIRNLAGHRIQYL